MSESNSLIRQWRLLQFLADACHGYPQGFVFHRGSLYLEAWSSRRGEIRTYKMDRIEDVQSTKLAAVIPENFDLAEWLQHSFGVFRSNTGQLQTIRIHFAREVARYVKESNWHKSQKLTPQDDGSLIAEIQLTDNQEIKRWIMSFGLNAKVLEPEELVEEIRKDLQEMIGTHQLNTPVDPLQNRKKETVYR